jgi:hypothetical protein
MQKLWKTPFFQVGLQWELRYLKETLNKLCVKDFIGPKRNGRFENVNRYVVR